jgi:hypothetical protein
MESANFVFKCNEKHLALYQRLDTVRKYNSFVIPSLLALNVLPLSLQTSVICVNLIQPHREQYGDLFQIIDRNYI